MRYLIIHENKPFYSEWFMAENNFVKGMMVIDFANHCYTVDGEIWAQIENDQL